MRHAIAAVAMASLSAIAFTSIEGWAKDDGSRRPARAEAFILVDSSTAQPERRVEMPACSSDFKAVKARLAADFAERPVSGGLQDDGNLLSVFASPATGTWTMVSTSPDGQSCIVAVGQDWQSQNSAIDASARI